MIYRNTFGPVSIGAQMQAKNVSNNSFVDGFGFSATVKILKELKLGAAFNRGYVNKDIIDVHTVPGLSDQPTYFTAGVSYTGEKLQLGAVYAHQTNGDLTQGYITDSAGGIHTPSVVFDAGGFELYGRYNFGKVVVLAGYNYYKPQTENITTPSGQKPIVPGYKKDFFLLGLDTGQPILGSCTQSKESLMAKPPWAQKNLMYLLSVSGLISTEHSAERSNNVP